MIGTCGKGSFELHGGSEYSGKTKRNSLVQVKELNL